MTYRDDLRDAGIPADKHSAAVAVCVCFVGFVAIFCWLLIGKVFP